MWKQMVKGAGGVAVALFLTPVAAHAQDMPAKPASSEVTVRGTVIDLDCKFRNGLQGEAMHRMCAQMCADAGLPLAILGTDGKLYMPVGGGMPGDPQNPRLKEFAEQQVVIVGNRYEAGGAYALEIKEIRRS